MKKLFLILLFFSANIQAFTKDRILANPKGQLKYAVKKSNISLFSMILDLAKDKSLPSDLFKDDSFLEKAGIKYFINKKNKKFSFFEKLFWLEFILLTYCAPYKVADYVNTNITDNNKKAEINALAFIMSVFLPLIPIVSIAIRKEFKIKNFENTKLILKFLACESKR